MGYGMNGYIGIAKETAWGTPVGAADYLKGFSESIQHQMDRFEVTNLNGGLYEPDDSVGLTRVAGDIVLPGFPSAVGYGLAGVLGVNSVTVVLSGVLFANAFTARTSDISTSCPHQPYTLEIFRDVTSAQQVSGVNLNKIAFSMQPNQDMRVTWGVIARNQTTIAKTSPTFAATPAAPFTFDTASVSIGGAAVSKLQALSIDIINPMEGVGVLNATNLIGKMRRTGPTQVGISGTFEFEDITEYNNFINQTEQRLTVNLTKANSFSLLLDIPRMVYTAYPFSAGGRDRINVSFTGKGRYHTGSLCSIKATLTTINTF